MAPIASADDSLSAIVRLVRAGGGRVTTSKRILIGALLSSEGHFTAEELCDLVHAQAPDISMSTIYRNLEELARLGVVVHSHLGHGAAVYHLASAAHAHLVCGECGVAMEAPEDLFGDLAEQARARYGFTVDTRHFAILGRCRACEAAADQR
jgi:Fe2+ or Zn2+ uptake regulation protein